METVEPPVIKRSLFSWIFPGNVHLQVTLLIIILFTVLARVVPLEMQKRIVNEAIKLREIDLLFTYCGIYLAAVVLASGFKYLINICSFAYIFFKYKKVRRQYLTGNLPCNFIF